MSWGAVGWGVGLRDDACKVSCVVNALECFAYSVLMCGAWDGVRWIPGAGV
jgi:hypothetical protein